MEDLPHCVVQYCIPFGAAAQKDPVIAELCCYPLGWPTVTNALLDHLLCWQILITFPPLKDKWKDAWELEGNLGPVWILRECELIYEWSSSLPCDDWGYFNTKHLMDVGIELMETANELGMSDNIDFRFIDTTYAFIWNWMRPICLVCMDGWIEAYGNFRCDQVWQSFLNNGMLDDNELV